MSSAPVRGIVPHRHRRHHHHHDEKHQRRHHSDKYQSHSNNQLLTSEPVESTINTADDSRKEISEEKRPKVNPIFLWAAQREQRIVEVRCEDYDKRNRIKLTKTAQGWRSIPRTVLTSYPIEKSIAEDEVDHQEKLSTTKNEGKENTSKERLKVTLEDNRAHDIPRLSKINTIQNEAKNYEHKRKKYYNISKSKKRRADSETNDLPSEIPLITSCKMEKQRKLDKSEERTIMEKEDDILKKNKINNSSDIKIKEESNNDAECLDELSKTDDFNVVENEEDKMYVNIIGNSLDDDNQKFKHLKILRKDQHLQPRVVLEQLLLSQLPTKIHQRLHRERSESTSSNGNNRNIDIDDVVIDSIENNSQNDSENRTDAETEEAIVNKEDFQEILDIFSSNDFSANRNQNSTSLIESKNFSENCGKLNSIPLASNQKDNKIYTLTNECAKSNYEFEAPKIIGKSGERNHIKHRAGSKSLDETIERLEKSINYQKKMGSLPNLLLHNIGTKASSATLSHKDKLRIPKRNTNIAETSNILNVLKNNPDLSISLAVNDVKYNNCSNSENITEKQVLLSRSPDSQTGSTAKLQDYIAETSAIKYICRNVPKSISPILKNRADSPESTVNLPKYTSNSYEIKTDEINEDEECDSQVIEETNDYGTHGKDSDQCFPDNREDCRNNDIDGDINYLMDYTKTSNHKSHIQVVSRNSEAQAKYTNLSRYQDVENIDGQTIDEFESQISPEPSDLPYKTLSSRKSAYLERLLPSPPCSVSCSEDANHDLTLKGILNSTNNIDSRSANKNYCKVTDLSIHADTELNSAYNYGVNEPCFNSEKTPGKREKFTKDSVKYLERNSNQGRSMSSSEMHNHYAIDYIPPKRPLSAGLSNAEQKKRNGIEYISDNIQYTNENEVFKQHQVPEPYENLSVFLDPASQLRELIKTSGHLIPDPLLVPRDYLPLLAGAPLTEIPKLLAMRPELRLPEALSRPELLRDPDLLVISLAHLQHVLDHGEASDGRICEFDPPRRSSSNQSKSANQVQETKNEQRPKLSCKPIGKLMPAPIDLSNNDKSNSNPPLLRIRSGLLKQESEVSSTANSPEDLQLWHPLFGSQKQRQPQQHEASWHRTTMAS